MRGWLKNFLPIVLVALAVQVFAPIAACWAASIAASDPLSAAVICHGNGGAGSGQEGDQPGAHGTPRGCCALCGVLHAGAAVDPPRIAVLVVPDLRATSVVWHELALGPTRFRAGSPEQARAPPQLT